MSWLAWGVMIGVVVGVVGGYALLVYVLNKGINW